ncbi:hypothetical protein ABZ690_28365, partial [Streptomyces sp. NPDC006967]|uniref:hypothetical protein n=1 Tax=unclassified Streptomyces TaxID=2593676 RepID=UPI0033C7749C
HTASAPSPPCATSSPDGHGCCPQPAETPKQLPAEWVDWYNHRRLHGEIGHVPPVEYEANYYTELTKLQVITTI